MTKMIKKRIFGFVQKRIVRVENLRKGKNKNKKSKRTRKEE